MIQINIGIIGVGSIGRFLLEKLNEEKLIAGYRITSIFDTREKSRTKLQELSDIYKFSVFDNLDQFLASNIDVVVECANIQVVNDYAAKIIQHKDLLLISVGALANALLHKELSSIARLNERKIYLPAGAIGGLDVVKAAKLMNELKAVTLVSRKPPSALSDMLLEKEKVLFEGSAAEAIKRYPQNANVAITLSLAGIGAKDTLVKIIADPFIKRNIHTIHAQGNFGKLEMTIENNPSPSNPKTSYLTALSVLASLKALDEQIIIG